jgi:hypothetical protein
MSKDPYPQGKYQNVHEKVGVADGACSVPLTSCSNGTPEKWLARPVDTDVSDDPSEKVSEELHRDGKFDDARRCNTQAGAIEEFLLLMLLAGDPADPCSCL